MQKKYKVKIVQTAQNDIEDIWNYISTDSFQNAINFINEIEDKILSLSTNPKRQPIIPECEFFPFAQYRHLVYKKYRIIYRIQSDSVLILRVFHGSMLLDITNI